MKILAIESSKGALFHTVPSNSQIRYLGYCILMLNLSWYSCQKNKTDKNKLEVNQERINSPKIVFCWFFFFVQKITQCIKKVFRTLNSLIRCYNLWSIRIRIKEIQNFQHDRPLSFVYVLSFKARPYVYTCSILWIVKAKKTWKYTVSNSDWKIFIHNG